MKTAIIVFLGITVIGSGLYVFSLKKELAAAVERAGFYSKRSDDLGSEVLRVSRSFDEQKKVLYEIKQSITELEDKVQLETLQRSIPKKTWDEIKPIIDRLKAFQGPAIDSGETISDL